MENIIEITNVRKIYRTYQKKSGLKNMIKNIIYPDFKDFIAVDDMSFCIRKGDIVGYIGPNGAGKSTTIKMLTGILVPNSGMIKVFGKDPLMNIPWWRSHPIHENRATESICTEPCNPLLRATKSTKRATLA